MDFYTSIHIYIYGIGNNNQKSKFKSCFHLFSIIIKISFNLFFNFIIGLRKSWGLESKLR